MNKKKKNLWLDRRIAAPGPFLALCLSEEEFETALKDCKVKMTVPWISTPQAHATTHHLSNIDGSQVCVVCLNDWKKRNAIEVAGLLIHEAVHVWQEYCLFYGETNPGREQEAYGVQAIAQELMDAFARRTQ